MVTYVIRALRVSEFASLPYRVEKVLDGGFVIFLSHEVVPQSTNSFLKLTDAGTPRVFL